MFQDRSEGREKSLLTQILLGLKNLKIVHLRSPHLPYPAGSQISLKTQKVLNTVGIGQDEAGNYWLL